MSTRCRIAIQQPDGKIRSIYCHHDGYIESVGRILKEHYNTPEKVNKLLDLGDVSSLGEKYDKEISKLNWKMFDKDLTDKQKELLEKLEAFEYTTTYNDRGEKTSARLDENLFDFMDQIGCSMEEYTYLFSKDYMDNYRWQVSESPYFHDYEV